jgi:putative endonuclease
MLTPMLRTLLEPDDAAARRARGIEAERLAAAHLQARGLVVIARNFRCRLGELDLVCADGGVLVVVEVRQRSSRRFGGALASLTPAKRRRIARAAGVFVLAAPAWRRAPVRSDVVAIEGRPEAAHEILWIQNAF